MSETDLKNVDIDTALNEAKEAYVATNPKSLARYVEATAVMPGGNTRTVLHYAPFPLAMARAEGCRLWDADGHEFVDFLGEYTAGIYGHSHPVIRKAVDGALDKGINFGASNLTEARFARAVCDRFGLDRIRFTNSGTEANLLAISLARIFTKRSKVLTFDGGYHGAVFGFAGGGSPINVPFDYVMAPYNDMEKTRALIAENAADLAVVILEPMMGSGGCIIADPDFLKMLREETTRVGALLIFDEVMTSRLSPGGLQAVRGVKPDLTTLGKYIGGGMSFGAFGGRGDIMDLFDPRRPDALPHAGTFNNNVLSMSAGMLAMGEIFDDSAAEALRQRGDGLRDALNAICTKHGVAMQFTGIGSMVQPHFRLGPILRPYTASAQEEGLRELFFLDMMKAGIYIARRGMVALSLPVGAAELARYIAAVEEFCASRKPLMAA